MKSKAFPFFLAAVAMLFTLSLSWSQMMPGEIGGDEFRGGTDCCNWDDWEDCQQTEGVEPPNECTAAWRMCDGIGTLHCTEVPNQGLPCQGKQYCDDNAEKHETCD